MNRNAGKPWNNPRLSFWTRMGLAWEEDKRKIREASWPMKILLVGLRILALPFVLVLLICMWSLVGILYVGLGLFYLFSHWQTYALLAVTLLIITLIHFGII
jgi:hypothetical protein